MKKLLFIILALLIAVPAYPAQWNKLLPATTDEKVNWPAQAQQNQDALDRTLQGYREGLRLTYSSASTLVVTAGQVWVSNATGTIRLALSNAASTNVTFTNIDTGSEAASTTYYVYAIADAADSEAVTFKVSTSATAPSGVTYYKRLGSFFNDASSNITRAGIYNDNEQKSTGLALNTHSVNTVYQNTSSRKIFVVVSEVRHREDGTWAEGRIGEASPPTTVVNRWYGSGGGDVTRGSPGGFIVPPGWYWTVTRIVPSATVGRIESFEM